MPVEKSDLKELESELKEILSIHEQKLSNIADTLQRIAVQDQRIGSVEDQLRAMWKKWDMLTNPQNGTIALIRNHQASCPRNQVKALWYVVIPTQVVWILSTISLLVKIYGH